MTPTKTAFLTGGTGFLGRNLAEELCGAGWNVVALHRPGSDVRALRELGVELRPGDVSDPASVRAAMPERAGAVFHLAASTSTWRRTRDTLYRVNVEGTRHVVDAALARHAQRFVHTSSVAAWGIWDGTVTEDAPSRAMDCSVHYCRTKWLGEEEVRRGAREGLDTVILNPSNLLGRYDRSGWSRVFRLVADDKLPGIPPGSTSFCCVREAARAHVAAVDRGRAGHNYILAGADATYAEMFGVIARLLDKPVRAKPASAWVLRLAGAAAEATSMATNREPPITTDTATLVCSQHRCSYQKAERELGFKAAPLELMLRECGAWLRAEGLLDSRAH